MKFKIEFLVGPIGAGKQMLPREMIIEASQDINALKKAILALTSYGARPSYLPWIKGLTGTCADIIEATKARGYNILHVSELKPKRSKKNK